MEQREFELLIDKFLQENISSQELDDMLREIKLGKHDGALGDVILEKFGRKAYSGYSAGTGEEEMFNRILKLAKEQEEGAGSAKVVAMPVKRKYKPLLRFAVAAAILVLGVSTVYFIQAGKKRAITGKNNNIPALQNDFAPGTDKAILTLANGSTVVLNSQQEGTVSTQGNTKVVKVGDGQLAYKPAVNGNTTEVTYNTLTTPRGGKYRVVLPDGTNVWLNAASSLRFPTSFTGSQRNVEITGEAYFEVTKNKAMPFIVSARGMKVEVLGTHFNVMTYADESAMKTTLLEGLVKVYNGNKSVTIQPAAQAKITQGSDNIDVAEGVDVDKAVAWKNDMFMFSDAGIQEIMRQVSRWYDVDVSYEGPISADHFTGKISRNATASQVLKILELSDVHFTIQGKKIIVKS